MTTLNRQLETRLGIDDAFAFIADFGNSMHWDPGTATSEPVSSAASPGVVASENICAADSFAERTNRQSPYTAEMTPFRQMFDAPVERVTQF